MLLRRKVQGGALFYALVVSVVIGILVSAFIARATYHRQLCELDVTREEMVRNAESAVVYACNVKFPEDSIKMDLFGRGKDSVALSHYNWGLYNVCTARAYRGPHSSTKCALIGSRSPENNFALWLADMDRALGVCGDTKLEGTCYLPVQGIERMYIEGKSFTGRDLVNGTVQQSERYVPSTDKERLTALKTFLEQPVGESEEWQSGSTIVRSFGEELLILNSGTSITIDHDSISGHVLIVSSRSISVTGNAFLHDVILFAPRIEFKSKMTGSVQAFAYDSIIVNEIINLKYPSVLGLIPHVSVVANPCIQLAQEVNISGELFATQDPDNPKRIPMINVGDTSEIAGTIYCNGSLQLHGVVEGSVIAEKLVYKSNSAFYDNCLMDARISSSSDQPKLPGGYLINNTPDSDVIEWLH